MKFILSIDCNNDSFGWPGEEVANILETLVPRVRECAASSRDEEDPFLLRDSNGNTVGFAQFEGEVHS